MWLELSRGWGRWVLGVVGLGLGLLTLSGCDTLRVFFPSSHHDEVAPELPVDLPRPAILVFSKTNGFRHAEALEAGVPVLEKIARDRGFGFFATENGAVHDPEILSRFDAVVWFQVSGDVLGDEQRAALLSFIESGGGFFGIHGTGGDSSYKWPAHPRELVGAQFVGHPMGPQFQEATVQIESPSHPVMQRVVDRVGPQWSRTDEWYSFEKSPRGPGVSVLATLDESTYEPRMQIAFIDRDLRMGEDHPIVWTHCLGRGRVLYSALGHQAAAYAEPPHLAMLEDGMAWLSARPASGCVVP